MHNKGLNIDPGIFDLKFNPPQNFASYRQAEMDGVRVGVFGQMIAVPYMSKRFAMKRFLGLTDEEIIENEEKWQEENLEDPNNAASAAAELRSAGVTASGAAADMGSIDSAGIPPAGMEDENGMPMDEPQAAPGMPGSTGSGGAQPS